MSEPVVTILVVDDESAFATLISEHLSRQGHRVLVAADSAAAQKVLKREQPDLMLLDVHMPGMSGLELIDALRTADHLPPTVVMSAYGDLETALTAVRSGALDFLSKPFRLPELELKVQLALDKAQRGSEGAVALDPKPAAAATPTAAEAGALFHGMVGRSGVMTALFTKIDRVARFTSTVQITGESGTGKELVARALHAASPRSEGPFIAVNCGAIPHNLLESELFGHVRGAFTDASQDRRGLFEQAHQGTLFLDEIVDLPLLLQVKLLRVLQQGEVRRVGGNRDISVDVRVVAASAISPREMVAAGRFREDLFYRLSVIDLQVAPLRDRVEDIPLLVQYIVANANRRLGTSVRGLHPHALARLMAWPWPGNVRELQNAIEQACVMCEGDEIGLDTLPARLLADLDVATGPSGIDLPRDSLSIPAAVQATERALIDAALRRTAGNRTHAAELLEISQRSLLNKIQLYDIDIPGQVGRPPRR